MSIGQTPSQTVGPFFGPSLIRPGGDALTTAGASGERIMIEGSVLDGDRAPVTDAMIEIWQANTAGRYDHPEDEHEAPLDPRFHGFGRTTTDAHGRFRFVTIKPGAVPAPDGALQAPHINVSIFARGLLKRLATRIYFPGERFNDTDLVLGLVPANRRATLIARAGRSGFTFDIILQGDGETVFFAI